MTRALALALASCSLGGALVNLAWITGIRRTIREERRR